LVRCWNSYHNHTSASRKTRQPARFHEYRFAKLDIVEQFAWVSRLIPDQDIVRACRTVFDDGRPDHRLESTITAPVRGTLLSRYGATVNAVANDWTEQKYIAKFGSLDAMTRPKPTAGKMPWTPRKGDPMRGIPKGKKSNGIRVAVRAGGGQQNISYAFLMPLSAGSVRGGNGLGVFARPKSGGKMKSIYGPSLDQIAKRVWTNESDRIGDELSEYVADHIDQQLKVLK
jgi:hypothetical protein